MALGQCLEHIQCLINVTIELNVSVNIRKTIQGKKNLRIIFMNKVEVYGIGVTAKRWTNNAV